MRRGMARTSDGVSVSTWSPSMPGALVVITLNER